LLPATRIAIQPPAASELFAYEPAVIGDRLDDQIETFDEANGPPHDDLGRAAKRAETDKDFS
jgi:hypothetical protein